MAVTRIRRVQDKGYRRKGWLRDPDSAPSSEKILRPSSLFPAADSGSNIKTNLRIFRPVVVPPFPEREPDQDSMRPSLFGFLEELDGIYAERWSRRKSPVRRDLSITYFGDYAIRCAIQSSTDPIYRNFGTNIKTSRDIVTKLKGSFMDFLSESRAVQVAMQDPFVPLGLEGANDMDEYSRATHGGILPGDAAYKWSTAEVGVAPTPILLPGNHRWYLALDIDQNDFLQEEREDIRDFFQTQHHLALQHRPHERNGEEVPDMLHGTVARFADDEWRWMVRNAPMAPETVSLLPPVAKFFAIQR